MRELPFNPLEDFEYLLQYTYYISALTVNADSDVETMEDFIERVREDPTTIVGMSGGAGQPQHLVLEQVKQVEDVEWVWQSYQGGAPTMTALLGNHIDAAAPGGEMIPMARAGQVRMIAILNDMRLEEFPDVPTLMDLGYDFSVPSLVGLVAPKDTPGEILQVLEEAFLQATEDPEFIAAMNNILMPVLIRDSSDFYSYVEHMYNVNREVINELGLGMDQ
jgi:tripartite-type tricarboxylate transporter receptor subunit TctC